MYNQLPTEFKCLQVVQQYGDNLAKHRVGIMIVIDILAAILENGGHIGRYQVGPYPKNNCYH